MFGVSVSVGVVAVKVAVAESLPPSLPETVTVWAPAETLGTEKVQEKVPVAEVVCEVQVWVAMAPPAIVIVPMAVLTEYPVPLTVTEDPTGPWLGVRVIVGVVIVKVAEAVSEPPSLPVATTV